jgi:hypothetical protein
MIDLKSYMTGVAKKSSASRKSAAGMSSPGEEKTGEGELNTEPGSGLSPQPQSLQPRMFACLAEAWRSRMKFPAKIKKPNSASIFPLSLIKAN